MGFVKKENHSRQAVVPNIIPLLCQQGSKNWLGEILRLFFKIQLESYPGIDLATTISRRLHNHKHVT